MEKERRYNIDWIRVIAFDLLILYHVGMVFVPWNWIIKNNVTSEAFVIPMMFLNQWRLPLLFIISGMGTYYALSFRTRQMFIRERAFRLIIPLIFGMLVLVPPQVYLERLNQGANYSSIIEFYTHLFNGMYPKGNLSWHHLWFVFYLFFYSWIFASLFIYIRNNPNINLIKWLESSMMKFPAIIYLFCIPLIIIEAILNPRYPVTMAFIGDWYALSLYAVLFIYGFLLISLKGIIWEFLEKGRFFFLFVAIICTISFFIIIQTDFQLSKCIIKILNIWSWILAILGYSAKYLNKPSSILSYRNQAVYPFYVLHHTVLVILAYYIVKLNFNISIKFLILVIGTFGITWFVYEMIIRRIGLFRFLFGMKYKKAK
jgi:glucans biosynthesis protein C